MKKNQLKVLIFSTLVFVIVGCENQKELSPSKSKAKSARVSAAIIGVNVVLNRPITPSILKELNTFGKVKKVFSEINSLSMLASSESLVQLNALSFVKSAGPDTERNGSPVDQIAGTDFSGGLSTWNLDAVNVTDAGVGRTLVQDGSGVYVAVLDTGLPDSWRKYFPEERIAANYAKSFGGGGGEVGNVSEQPNKWEHDQNGHGGHVTSAIIGYQIENMKINGTAPMAKIIPVKVLNQVGWGWGSVIAEGIIYVGNLKAGPLANSPVIINMSLGGSILDAVEAAAVDYAISKGVIIVASAGNSGTFGMGYPGGYSPVLSVACLGWMGQFTTPFAGLFGNVPDPSNVDDYFILPFSSREKPGQDLDVSAPGLWTLGPYQINSGNTLSWYFLSGTSMSSPHVAGIVALMAQKKPSLTAPEAEHIVESTALPIGAGSKMHPAGFPITWGIDAPGHGLIMANAALAATL
jgi:subtilisin family serine protease